MFGDAWIICFTVAVFLAINSGGFLLCFRAKKYICLFVVGELASLILFSIQFYMLIDQGDQEKVNGGPDSVTNSIRKGDLQIYGLVCVGLMLLRCFLFII